MSLNLPPARLLKRTRGDWTDVTYPTHVLVRVTLTPKDFFEAVDPEFARSCVPVNGTGFSYLFDSNSGKMVLRGSTMFPAVSMTFEINDGAWSVSFQGQTMEVAQPLEQESDIDQILTHCEHTLPALLSLATGLAISAKTIELNVGDIVAARAETLLPPNGIRVLDESARALELKEGIELLGIALGSGRFILACSYLREALFFDAPYHDHNPYTHSLLVILKCAQAIEVLFGGRYDTIRSRCSELGISGKIVESQLIPVMLVRNTLGSAHASAFVPSNEQADLLRKFATRSASNVRRLLTHIAHADSSRTVFLLGAVARDRDKEKVFAALASALEADPWSAESVGEMRTVFARDPRLSS